MKKIKNNNHTTANPKQDRKEGEKKNSKKPQPTPNSESTPKAQSSKVFICEWISEQHHVNGLRPPGTELAKMDQEGALQSRLFTGATREIQSWASPEWGHCSTERCFCGGTATCRVSRKSPMVPGATSFSLPSACSVSRTRPLNPVGVIRKKSPLRDGLWPLLRSAGDRPLVPTSWAVNLNWV